MHGHQIASVQLSPDLPMSIQRDLDPAMKIGLETGNDSEQGGFSRARGPQDTKGFAEIHIEGQVDRESVSSQLTRDPQARAHLLITSTR